MKTLGILYPESLLGYLHVFQCEASQAAERERWGISALQMREDELESNLNVDRTLHDLYLWMRSSPETLTALRS
jgi:hypothetical protein